MWLQRAVVALLTCLVVAPVGGAHATTTDIDVTYTVSGAEGAAAEVELAVSFPDRVSGFRVRPPATVAVVDGDGFSRSHDGETWVWDGSTGRPTLTYEVPTDAATFSTSGYVEFSRTHVESGLSWRYRGDPPELSRTTRVAGNENGTVYGFGVALWDRAVTAESADGTVVSVVVPPESGPGSVDIGAEDLRALGDDLVAVDEFFRFDRPDDHLVVFVRPTDSAGLEGSVVGSANRGGRILLEPGVVGDPEVLAHEYTHTQQDFVTSRELNWFVEGSAEYYGTYYAYHAGGGGFDRFHDALTVDEPYADTDLRGLTNASETADYEKGGHVAAGLDAEIRRRSGGTRRLADVLVALRGVDGGDPTVGDRSAVLESQFLDLAEDAAGESLDGWYERAVSGVPPALPREKSLYAPPSAEPSSGDTAASATATPVTPATPASTPTPTATRAPSVATGTATPDGETLPGTSTSTPTSPAERTTPGDGEGTADGMEGPVGPASLSARTLPVEWLAVGAGAAVLVSVTLWRLVTRR